MMENKLEQTISCRDVVITRFLSSAGVWELPKTRSCRDIANMVVTTVLVTIMSK